MFQRIAVIGLGLLGGSICKSLRSLGYDGEIVVYARNPEKVLSSVTDGAVDRILPLDSLSLNGVDLVVIAAPVVSSVEILKKLLTRIDLNEETLIIDVGSVKRTIVNEALRYPRGDRFIGCHPMTGSEKTGYEYSSDRLYADAQVIITPHEKNRVQDIDRVQSFWRLLGAKTSLENAKVHDAVVARTSHLPHLLACLLVEIAESETKCGTDVGRFLGNGFRDMTRIAGGSPEMWSDIFVTNSDNVCSAIDKLKSGLDGFKTRFSGSDPVEDLKKWLHDIRRGKERL